MEKCNFLSIVISFARDISLLTYLLTYLLNYLLTYFECALFKAPFALYENRNISKYLSNRRLDYHIANKDGEQGTTNE